jgi:hypothetical protein
VRCSAGSIWSASGLAVVPLDDPLALAHPTPTAGAPGSVRAKYQSGGYVDVYDDRHDIEDDDA